MLQKLLLHKMDTMKFIVLLVLSISIISIPCLLLSATKNHTHLTTTKSSLEHLLDSFLSLIPKFSSQICNENSGIEVDSDVQGPLFIYPPQYGAEKYLLRKATLLTNKSCDLYSHTSAAEVLRQIEKADLIQNSSFKYLKLGGGTPGSSSIPVSFGADLDFQNRKQYFKISDGMELPCGFANYNSPGFLVSDGDKEAMDKCRGLVVISAIFGGYDRLRQPKRVRKISAENVCFFMFVDNVTLEKLAGHGIEPDKFHKIGVWRIVLVKELPYKEYVMDGLIPKYLPHRLFPNCMYTIWADAKIQLTVDPLLILENLLIKQKADMALSRHAYNIHTMEEAIFTVRWRKWNKEGVRQQMENYCADGLQPWNRKKLPYVADVGDTALILRKNNLPANLFSCLVFNEIQVFNPRDQLAFAYVRDKMSPKVKIHMFSVDIFNTITNEYRHFSKPSISSKEHEPGFNQGIFVDQEFTACRSYLDIMWNTSNK
ncbi:hypothetical protein SUGI_0498640 [Cryptomeria japonica]|nr:hypothetical protein SUGI_0498640 [Cryptomeria japonica]